MNTKIRDIEPRQITVEALVLSWPATIKMTHPRYNSSDCITHVVLGDETGVIILIDDINSGKLNKLKKGDKVRVSAAEGNKIYYDVDGVLRSKDIDLYISKFTSIVPI